MENAMVGKIIMRAVKSRKGHVHKASNLSEAQVNKEYVIKEVKTDDEELKKFLFTLGCYEGETVTVLSVLGENYVISVKDARYSIDKNLAEAIII